MKLNPNVSLKLPCALESSSPCNSSQTSLAPSKSTSDPLAKQLSRLALLKNPFIRYAVINRQDQPVPRGLAARAVRIFDTLATQHPGASTELKFQNAYQLLVATILSAQCTDKRVNQVTTSFFARYPDSASLAEARTKTVENHIRSTGFFKAKARSLIGMASAINQQHGGTIPATIDDLVRLPGVGRKTANVVLGHALGVPGFPVDRHVLRVSKRLGLTTGTDPVIVENQLTQFLPSSRWTNAADTLILHGRRICKTRPLCDQCPVTQDCVFRLKQDSN